MGKTGDADLRELLFVRTSFRQPQNRRYAVRRGRRIARNGSTVTNRIPNSSNTFKLVRVGYIVLYTQIKAVTISATISFYVWLLTPRDDIPCRFLLPITLSVPEKENIARFVYTLFYWIFKPRAKIIF